MPAGLSRSSVISPSSPHEGAAALPDWETALSPNIDGPSACVERIGDNFVFEGVLPRDMTLCGTSPLPGDTKVYPLAGPFDRMQGRDRRSPSRSNAMLTKVRTDSISQF